MADWVFQVDMEETVVVVVVAAAAAVVMEVVAALEVADRIFPFQHFHMVRSMTRNNLLGLRNQLTWSLFMPF